MIVVAWDIRGLNDPFKQREIRRFVYKYKVFLLCLVETRVREENIGIIMVILLLGWGL